MTIGVISLLPGSRVKVKTFHGTRQPTEPVDSNENYWRLVNETGTVVGDEVKVHPAFPEKGDRVLVKFDIDLRRLNLESHNTIDNALWIFLSDLVVLSEESEG